MRCPTKRVTRTRSTNEERRSRSMSEVSVAAEATAVFIGFAQQKPASLKLGTLQIQLISGRIQGGLCAHDHSGSLDSLQLSKRLESMPKPLNSNGQHAALHPIFAASKLPRQPARKMVRKEVISDLYFYDLSSVLYLSCSHGRAVLFEHALLQTASGQVAKIP